MQTYLLSARLSTYLPALPAFLPASLPASLPACLLPCLPHSLPYMHLSIEKFGEYCTERLRTAGMVCVLL